MTSEPQKVALVMSRFVRGFQKIRRFYGVKVRKFPYKSWPIFAIWPEERKLCPTFDLSKLFSLKSVFVFNSVSAIKSVSSLNSVFADLSPSLT